MEKSNNDCYFYYYSTCTKGDDCPFRHCAEALGNKPVCKYWLKRRDCDRKNCPFRHMDSKRERASTPCYYETKESGCMKPHCTYRHSKPRPHLLEAIQQGDPGVILPVKVDVTEVNSEPKNSRCKTSQVTDVRSTVPKTLRSDSESEGSQGYISSANDDEDRCLAVASDESTIRHLVKDFTNLSCEPETSGKQRNKNPIGKVGFVTPNKMQSNSATQPSCNESHHSQAQQKSNRKLVKVSAKSASVVTEPEVQDDVTQPNYFEYNTGAFAALTESKRLQGNVSKSEAILPKNHDAEGAKVKRREQNRARKQSSSCRENTEYLPFMQPSVSTAYKDNMKALLRLYENSSDQSSEVPRTRSKSQKRNVPSGQHSAVPRTRSQSQKR